MLSLNCYEDDLGKYTIYMAWQYICLFLVSRDKHGISPLQHQDKHGKSPLHLVIMIRLSKDSENILGFALDVFFGFSMLFLATSSMRLIQTNVGR